MPLFFLLFAPPSTSHSQPTRSSTSHNREKKPQSQEIYPTNLIHPSIPFSLVILLSHTQLLLLDSSKDERRSIWIVLYPSTA
ncbi:hypothetical protein M441DRAFT_60117 [Trichoderma asperellum CBS 433.97]|uniref:Uncharacterized protein n=1 Tax=Trichoderma asperellum (strain ATCC 204424 / CBS 433.97 / NBRC 101777) TaxID=1042311 RepID=A0A2T3Z251_TRIA4|nr:hypothetical protein M441DRAFT_60117 [Trichoderma asperellum CBS 433.97]PTB38891.1 hypothetical protein M441DRAFT_60117 [Trichoderma asperellum CBS 433.97]